MKFNRIISAFALALLIPSMTFAQDARQRTPQTIVADVLAEIPMEQHADFDTAMNDLLGTGSFGVTQLAKMLVPASRGENNRVEYALDGLVAYAGSHASEAQRAQLCEGFDAAIKACNDNPNKAFLMALLSRISRPADAPVFVEYLADPYLSEHAQSALILTPGTDDVVMGLIAEGKLPQNVLARLAGAKHIAAAEPVLLDWLKKADSETATSIYRALAECGTAKALPALAKGAKNENYKWVSTDATAAYVSLLNRLASNPADCKVVAKEAKALLKKNVNTNVRTGALTALFRAEGVKSAPELYKAMSDPDRQYRVAALRQCEPWAGEEVVAKLGEIAIAPKTPVQVKTDIVNWIGANKYDSQIAAVVDNINSNDTELSDACFMAASRIGGDRALRALLEQLAKQGDVRSDKAYRALLSFNGDIKPSVLAMLEPSASVFVNTQALKLASARRVKEAAPRVMAMLAAPEMSDAAYAALPGVVAPAQVGDLCKLLESVPASRRETVQTALVAALRQLPAADQYAAIKTYVDNSKNRQLYYSAMATTGSPEAVTALTEAYKVPATRDAALAALLDLDSPAMVDVLYDIAVENEAANNAALKRYAVMVDRYGKDNIGRYNLYRRGLEISKSAEIDNLLIGRLAGTGTYGALKIAAARVDEPATAAASAAAIRSIMTKHLGEYQGDEVRAAIVKAMDYYKSQTHDADAGYAVDDLKGMLVKYDALAANAVAPMSELTAEEKAQGFDMLFDGTSLKKWTGDTATYIIKDGCITVNAAHWGNNIYTADEYGNFVFRFEFALDRPGVNNGVGIRTPMNVDAAFHGMEIQILDHDDPMYADIADYQVHGSVYGVIPAKRVKFKHGEWNTEEIRAEGDRITVTVNGKVILDGNIREACQGHAVGDPGEEGNHYMIDHRNHPGLFNKTGHIGFLGHGDGIRFRNVRILDLDRK